MEVCKSFQLNYSNNTNKSENCIIMEPDLSWSDKSYNLKLSSDESDEYNAKLAVELEVEKNINLETKNVRKEFQKRKNIQENSCNSLQQHSFVNKKRNSFPECNIDDIPDSIVNVVDLISKLLNSKVVLERLPPLMDKKQLPSRMYEKIVNTTKPSNNDVIMQDQTKENNPHKLTLRYCLKCNEYCGGNTHNKCKSFLYECFKCHEQFKSYDRVAYHLIIKCNVKTIYQCPECEYKSPRRACLKRHIKLHSNFQIHKNFENPEKCPLCSEMFQVYSSLLQHVLLYHHKDYKSLFKEGFKQIEKVVQS